MKAVGPGKQSIAKFSLLAWTCLCCFSLHSQHSNFLKVSLDDETKTLQIQQEFTYYNSSADTLRQLIFNDWAHAYASKRTALAKRFSEEFKRSLHLAKDSERGYTDILTVVDEEYRGIPWERTKAEDLISFELKNALVPGDSTKLFLTYVVQLPPNKYTPYGYSNDGSYYLKDWYLTPAVYENGWKLYSNKNLEDQYTEITNTQVNITYPPELHIGTNYTDTYISQYPNNRIAFLRGDQRKNCDIILNSNREFVKHVTSSMVVVTDIQSTRYQPIKQGLSIDRVTRFIYDNLGEFPYSQLLVSEIDFNKNPLYGLNQLPSFIRPYEEQFQFEMKFLKTALNSYLRESIFIDPRKEQWVNDAIVHYLMIRYVETFYPDQKLLGKLANIWGVRSFKLAKMDFNDQYPFLYMVTARKNLDQPLTTPNDSLIKFNQKIANTYKAGLGLAYLGEIIGQENLDAALRAFYANHKLKETDPEDFEEAIRGGTDQQIDWFFKDYVNTSKRIDFKIQKVLKEEDSLTVVIKNKTGTNVPISLFGLQKDSVVSKYWFHGIKDESSFTIPRTTEERLVLNYDQKIPEFNQRDNWKTLGGFLSGNKKLQFQFFKDAENPYYNQVFYMPVAGFNIYDGLTPGMRFTNKTLLERPFIFDFAPSYATKEKSFVGYGRITYRDFLRKSGLYVVDYRLGGSTSHFQTNSRYSTITPSVTLRWRPDDLISNKRDVLFLRYVNVFRTIDPELGDLETDPDYRVVNLRYQHSNPGIIEYNSWFADFQYAGNFSKLSFNWELRKLYDNNLQLNLRFFAGKFISNTTNSDFFSFALDRPTDYLFDYNYLGRSEEAGIVSQQIIIAEGGFKSKLPRPFANDWMFTTNASFNIYRWIELYGDVGFYKNFSENSRFVYDSGIRLNLVTDYFELYFPIYSNNGWEFAQPGYDEKIRFIITLSPRTLTGLFTRQWF